MSTKLPPEVAKRVKKTVCEAADDVEYLGMSRTNAGNFLNGLVARQDVGEIIAQYVKKDQVRHYIKDAILNRYSKDKTLQAKPTDLSHIIREKYGSECEISHKEQKLALYRLMSKGHEKEYVVVADGTFIKWETALKKALLFIAARPFSKSASDIHILLLLYAQHKKVAPSDKKNLQSALAISNASAYLFGEG
jgi:predicted transcriptional regulator